MKKGYTHVSVLLDRSGSMDAIKLATIEGFNSFLTKQKEQPEQMTLSLSQFDDYYEVIYDMLNINSKKIKLLTEETFVPRGWTALLDSLATLINETGKKFAQMDEADRPEKVLFLVLTDGYENRSKEQTKESIKKMIEHQESKYNWEFMYIGANQDSFLEASKMGMKGTNFRSTKVGTDALFAAMSNTVASYRSAPSSVKYSLNQEDIDKAEKDLSNNNK